MYIHYIVLVHFCTLYFIKIVGFKKALFFHVDKEMGYLGIITCTSAFNHIMYAEKGIQCEIYDIERC